MVRLLVFPVFAVCALTAVAQENPPASESPSFRPFTANVGNFDLTERSGKNFSALDLRGTFCVAHFFYPGCNGACTRTTPTMRRLQDTFRGKPFIRFVSLALNGDTPEVLEQYARDQNAEPGQWLFLTDKEDVAVQDIVQKCFFNPAYRKENPTPGDSISHSSRLVLISPEGMILGDVDGENPKSADVLAREIEQRRLEQRIPITGADLPRFNALLNASCTVLLLLGWTAIRLRFVTLHKILMLLALNVSMVFLASYLFYHFVVLSAEPMRFRGEGPVRYAYYAILLTHTVLAMAVAPLAIYTTVQGLRNALAQHVRIARWTLPIWLYVSVTGVIVYWMLYRAQW